MKNNLQNLKLKIGDKFEASATGAYAITILLIIVGLFAFFT